MTSTKKCSASQTESGLNARPHEGPEVVDTVARIAGRPAILANAKNHIRGIDVPYRKNGAPHLYRPEARVRRAASRRTTPLIDGKDIRGHDTSRKADTMRTKWITAGNRLNGRVRFCGSSGFAELQLAHAFGPDHDTAIDPILNLETP